MPAGSRPVFSGPRMIQGTVSAGRGVWERAGVTSNTSRMNARISNPVRGGRSELRTQPLDHPAPGIEPPVAQPVVQPVRPALPVFVFLGKDAEASPVLRPGYPFPGMTHPRVVPLPLELGPVAHHFALPRRPGADPASLGAGFVVRGRFRLGD